MLERQFISMLLGLLLVGCINVDSKVAQTKPCPKGMVYVYAPERKVEVCVDRYEYTPTKVAKKSSMRKAKPQSNMSYDDCRATCQRQGKRLLYHREWVTACEGTQESECNKFRSHPILRKVASNGAWRFQNKDCKRGNNAWLDCMQDPSLNQLPASLASNGEFAQCVSRFGVRNMIGNLGEWVQDVRHVDGKKMGQFDGGLYPQNRSSCQYKTIAHETKYKDYSIGCRCAKDVNQDKGRWEPF